MARGRIGRKSLLILLVFTALVALLVYQMMVCLRPSLRHPYLLQTLSKQGELLHSWLVDDAAMSLIPGAPPVIVHYLWCRKGQFEFKHYLSILSAVKLLRPEQVLFHYHHLPTKDPHGSVTWFEDLQRDVPFFVLNQDNTQYCRHDYFDKTEISVDGMGSSGIYVSDEVAVVNFTKKDFLNLAKSSKGNMHAMRIFLLPASEPHVVTRTETSAIIECPTLQEHHKKNKAGTQCIQLTERLSPFDIWHQKRPFYRFARTLIYGSSDVQVPVRNDTTLMPLHCHILHFTKASDLDLTAYASILSALGVAKMDHVFLHGDVKPVGPRWDATQLSERVTFIRVTQVNRWHPVVGDMLYGAYVLLRHGGVVIRSNTIWRKELSREVRSYTSVASLRRSVYRIINHSMDLGILMSKPGSQYLKLLIATLKQAPARHPEAMSEEVAYRAYVESPSSLRLESTLLQHVVCSRSACQPRPEDTGLGRSYAVEVEWKNGQPQTEAELAKYKGPGIDEMKIAIRASN